MYRFLEYNPKDKELYQRIANFKDYTTVCSSAPSEILATVALKNKDKIIKKHLARIAKNLAVLDAFFERNKTFFSWVRPKAGTICFPRLNISQGSFEFCETLVKKTQIMLVPSTVYDYDNKHFRLGFGRNNFPEALNKFGSYISKDHFKRLK